MTPPEPSKPPPTAEERIAGLERRLSLLEWVLRMVTPDTIAGLPPEARASLERDMRAAQLARDQRGTVDPPQPGP